MLNILAFFGADVLHFPEMELRIQSIHCFLFVYKLRNAVHWDQCDGPSFMPWFLKAFGKLTNVTPPNHDYNKGIVVQRKIITDYFGKYLQNKSKLIYIFYYYEQKPVAYVICLV